MRILLVALALLVLSVGHSRAETQFAPYLFVGDNDATKGSKRYSDDRAIGRIYLAFVNATKDYTTEQWLCAPAWEGADQNTITSVKPPLNEELKELLKSGKAVMSFGGAEAAKGAALWKSCTTPEALANSMAQAISAYGITEIDLDIEGSVTDVEFARIAAAIPLIKPNKKPVVTVTLSTDISTVTFLKQVREQFGGHVSQINLMTMEYGSKDNKNWNQLITASLKAAKNIWKDNTPPLSITLNIGKNELPPHHLTVEDARNAAQLAKTKNLKAIGFWALNRDKSCDSGIHYNPGALLCHGLEGLEPMAYEKAIKAELAKK